MKAINYLPLNRKIYSAPREVLVWITLNFSESDSAKETWEPTLADSDRCTWAKETDIVSIIVLHAFVLLPLSFRYLSKKQRRPGMDSILDLFNQFTQQLYKFASLKESLCFFVFAARFRPASPKEALKKHQRGVTPSTRPPAIP